MGAHHPTLMAFACGLAAWLAMDQIAHAQEGSIGGSLGKTDKSVSGGDDDALHRTKPAARNPVAGAKPTAASFGGHWVWTATCDDATDWKGSLELTQDSEGTVSGSVTNGSVSGKALGNTLTGRFCYLHCTQISFTLESGGGRLVGSEKSLTHGTCRYQGKRS
jgi:hypothetical protein